MKIAICDDNREILLYLKKSLNQLFKQYTTDFEIICFDNGDAFLNSNEKSNYDVVFLDIDMPVMSGFNVAKAMRMTMPRCYIVFITSHSELVYDSFEFLPFDFIRKNIDESLNKSLAKTVKKLMFHFKQNETVVLNDYYLRKTKVPICNIVYLESEKHYINYYVVGESTPYRLRDTITECEAKFEKYDFVRIHKSYLVNLKYIDIIDNSQNEIVLKEFPATLPISRNLKKEINEKYIAYLRNMI